MMRNFKNLALISSITLVALMGIFTVYNIDAATREENIQKIESFLNNEKRASFLEEKGTSPERIISQLDSLSDTQLEKLAFQANLQQVGGGLDDSGVSDFWKTWGLLIIIVGIVPIILILAFA